MLDSQGDVKVSVEYICMIRILYLYRQLVKLEYFLWPMDPLLYQFGLKHNSGREPYKLMLASLSSFIKICSMVLKENAGKIKSKGSDAHWIQYKQIGLYCK